VLLDVAYGGDITWGIGTTLTWAIAQISTGIIVACCLYLRSLFERLLPKKLTRVSTSRSTPQPAPHQDLEKLSLVGGDLSQESQQTTGMSPTRTRNDSITVTTTIEVHPRALSPDIKPVFHDGHRAPWAPTVRVEAKPKHDPPETPEASGCCC
jgi:hypothetical protein